MAVPDAALVAALRTAVEAAGGKVVRVDDEHCAHVVGRMSGRIYLDNLRRRVAAGESLPLVAHHAAQRFAASPAGPTSAPALGAGFRLALEQQEVMAGTSVVRRTLSPVLACALAWTDPDEAAVTLLGFDTLARWSLTEREAWDEAGRQMDTLLRQTPLEVEEVVGGRLGMLATASAFKASLITAPSLRHVVEPALGWSVLAVVPCRDFTYLLPETAQGLLGRLGGVVMREFTSSPYPLSPEAFRISDAGVQAIGTFAAS